MGLSQPTLITLGTTPAVARTMRFKSLAIDGVNRATQVHDYAAGKAINAARAAHTVGGTDVCCLLTAGGTRGLDLERLLDSEGLPFELTRVDAPTRLCVTLLDESAGTATELIEETATLSPEVGQRLLERFAEEARRRGVIAVLSGSLAPGLASNFYAECIARAGGCATVVDAAGEPLRLAIAARPSVVKVNAGELASITAGDTQRAAMELAQKTGGWIVVTRGAESTIAAHAGEGTFDVSVPRVERIVSTIGSGDSFAGGLAAALARGDPMIEALRIGAACATANVLTEHAAHFDRTVVERMTRDVRVTRV